MGSECEEQKVSDERILMLASYHSLCSPEWTLGCILWLLGSLAAASTLHTLSHL